ncbi:uncharacterized protein LOC108674451 isoform X2 [Hyalella azteca]|uniref:Uncharacterized protein LOC108674451 isoform X2 n=1 Tax=Hyalella azteca TaxID=294128 RepID=A0A8B7NVT7_HYAAZ|nr:uncharacterized protein LOC108674451 isoform X2 [Hyalella azteca]
MLTIAPKQVRMMFLPIIALLSTPAASDRVIYPDEYLTKFSKKADNTTRHLAGIQATTLIPHRGLEETIIPHRGLEETIIPHRGLEETIIPHRGLEETIIPHRGLEETIIPHRGLEETIIPHRGLEEDGDPHISIADRIVAPVSTLPGSVHPSTLVLLADRPSDSANPLNINIGSNPFSNIGGSPSLPLGNDDNSSQDANVRPSQPLSTGAHAGPPLSAGVHLGPPLSTSVHFGPPLSTGVHTSPLPDTGVHLGSPLIHDGDAPLPGFGPTFGALSPAKPTPCVLPCRISSVESSCCGTKRQNPSYVYTKPGLCPPVRVGCPNVRMVDTPSWCLYDAACDGVDKCCYDSCLQRQTCKPPLGVGR